MPDLLANPDGSVVANPDGTLAIPDQDTFNQCCCGSACGCCDCPSGQISYDATFSGDMAELNGTYTSVNRESYGDEGCRYTFGPDSPIGSITFACAGSYNVVYINAQTIAGQQHTYHNYSDGDWIASGCPINFGQLYLSCFP